MAWIGIGAMCAAISFALHGHGSPLEKIRGYEYILQLILPIMAMLVVGATLAGTEGRRTPADEARLHFAGAAFLITWLLNLAGASQLSNFAFILGWVLLAFAAFVFGRKENLPK